MDREQAAAVLAIELQAYRANSYEALRDLVGSLHAYEVANPAGHPFQVEIEIVWDVKPNIRVLSAIDDGGWSSFLPVCEDFVMTPEGPPPD